MRYTLEEIQNKKSRAERNVKYFLSIRKQPRMYFPNIDLRKVVPKIKVMLLKEQEKLFELTFIEKEFLLRIQEQKELENKQEMLLKKQERLERQRLEILKELEDLLT